MACNAYVYVDSLFAWKSHNYELASSSRPSRSNIRQGPLLLTLIPAWINDYTHYNVWDEITNPFLNFNGATVEV